MRTLELVMEYTDDKNSWKAALLHDVIEDSKPMELIEEGEEPKEKVTKEIYERYGERVLELCLLSTKNKERPKIDSFDGELRLFLEKFYGKHENTHD
ncbi:MAG: HD domain-containing protein [Candidatus Peribacteria bacterium]|nr:HD domain-containing protein [Candidatus Peribacteria bacterium]